MAKSKADRSGSAARGGSGSKEKDTPSRSSGGGSSRAPKSSPRPSSKPSSSFGGGGGGSRSSSKPDRSFGGGGGGSRPSSKPSPYFGGGGGSSAAAQEVARKAAAREQAAAAPAIAAAGPGPGFASDAGKRQFEQQSVAFYGGVLPPYVPLEPTDFPGPMPGYEFGLPPLGEAATVPAATTPPEPSVPGTLENMSIAEQYLSDAGGAPMGFELPDLAVPVPPTVDPLTAARDPNAPTIEDYMDLVSRTTGIGSTKPVPRPDNLVAPTVPTAPARTGYVSRPTDMVVSAAPAPVSPEMVGNVAASQAAYQDMLDRLNAAQAQQPPSVQTSVGSLGSDLAMDTLPSLSSDFERGQPLVLPSSGGLSASAPSALTESVYQAAESLAPRPSAPPPPAPPPPAPVPAPVPPSVLDSYSFETQPDIIEAPLSEAAVPPEMGLVPTTSRSSAAPTPEMIAADTAATARGVPGYVGVPVVGPILGGLSNAGRAIGDVFRGDRPLFGEGGLLPPDTRTTEEIFASMRERDDNDDSGTPSFATAETAPTPETQAPAEEEPAPYVLPPINYASLSDVVAPGAYGMTLEQYLELLRRFPGGAQGPQVPQGLMTVAPIDSGIGSLMG